MKWHVGLTKPYEMLFGTHQAFWIVGGCEPQIWDWTPCPSSRLLFQIFAGSFWHDQDWAASRRSYGVAQFGPAKLFKARTIVPDPISSCWAIALTLMPRRRSLITSSRSNIFLGRPAGRPDFVPCSRAYSRPATTRSRPRIFPVLPWQR
jgi:hypothetical protein